MEPPPDDHRGWVDSTTTPSPPYPDIWLLTLVVVFGMSLAALLRRAFARPVGRLPTDSTEENDNDPTIDIETNFEDHTDNEDDWKPLADLEMFNIETRTTAAETRLTSEMQSLREQLASSDHGKALLEIQLAEKQAELQLCNDMRESLEERNNSLGLTVEQVLAALDKERQQTEVTLQQLSTYQDRFKSRADAAALELEDISAAKAAETARAENALAECDSLRSKFADIESKLLRECADLKEKLSKSTTNEDSLRRKIDELQHQLNAKEVEAVRITKDAADSQASEIIALRTAVERANSQAESSRAEAATWRSRCKDLESANVTLEHDAKEAQSAMQQILDEHAELHKKAAALKETLDTTDAELVEARAALNDYLLQVDVTATNQIGTSSPDKDSTGPKSIPQNAKLAPNSPAQGETPLSTTTSPVSGIEEFGCGLVDDVTGLALDHQEMMVTSTFYNYYLTDRAKLEKKGLIPYLSWFDFQLLNAQPDRRQRLKVGLVQREASRILAGEERRPLTRDYPSNFVVFKVLDEKYRQAFPEIETLKLEPALEYRMTKFLFEIEFGSHRLYFDAVLKSRTRSLPQDFDPREVTHRHPRGRGRLALDDLLEKGPVGPRLRKVKRCASVDDIHHLRHPHATHIDHMSPAQFLHFKKESAWLAKKQQRALDRVFKKRFPEWHEARMKLRAPDPRVAIEEARLRQLRADIKAAARNIKRLPEPTLPRMPAREPKLKKCFIFGNNEFKPRSQRAGDVKPISSESKSIQDTCGFSESAALQADTLEKSETLNAVFGRIQELTAPACASAAVTVREQGATVAAGTKDGGGDTDLQAGTKDGGGDTDLQALYPAALLSPMGVGAQGTDIAGYFGEPDGSTAPGETDGAGDLVSTGLTDLQILAAAAVAALASNNPNLGTLAANDSYALGHGEGAIPLGATGEDGQGQGSLHPQEHLDLPTDLAAASLGHADLGLLALDGAGVSGGLEGLNGTGQTNVNQEDKVAAMQLSLDFHTMCVESLSAQVEQLTAKLQEKEVEALMWEVSNTETQKALDQANAELAKRRSTASSHLEQLDGLRRKARETGAWLDARLGQMAAARSPETAAAATATSATAATTAATAAAA
ncbi:hypothetical protein HDU96_001295 [Phlyctochytrium bullatum]|nr:hypothetical protein HDU96_001295 [Phlyctochytrium bullatum]